MDLSPDSSGLLALFQTHHGEFVVVGAHAVAYYGAPRFTGDLDILVKADDVNADRIVMALNEFGSGGSGISAQDVTEST